GGHVARDPDRLDRVRGRVEPLAALAREREEPAPDRLAGGHIRYTLGPAPAAARVDLDLAVQPGERVSVLDQQLRPRTADARVELGLRRIGSAACGGCGEHGEQEQHAADGHPQPAEPGAGGAGHWGLRGWVGMAPAVNGMYTLDQSKSDVYLAGPQPAQKPALAVAACRIAPLDS